MKLGRLRWLVVSIAVAGCGANLHSPDGPVAPSSFAEPIVDPLPRGGIEAAAKIPACLYWIEEKDGSLWRCALDGSNKEIVVDCRALKQGRIAPGVRLDGTPGKNSFLALGSVPGGSGYIIVDSAAKSRSDGEMAQAQSDLSGKTSTIKTPYTYGPATSPWSTTLRFRGIENLDHYHSTLDAIQLTNGKVGPVTYRFHEEDGKLLALLAGDFSILRDGTSIILWSLRDDRKYLLARGWFPNVWPRDLSKLGRFQPTAKAWVNRRAYTYKLKSPQDLHRTPEQMTPTGPMPRPGIR